MSAYEFWRVQVQYTAGVWTELTAYVDTMVAAVRATTGASAETTGDPASMSLTLNNTGFRFTPGSTSPLALSTGMPIRFFEVILDQYVYHFTGFIEFPEIASVNLSMAQDQTIAVSAVDQLSLWERSKTYVSTVGAQVIGTGGNSLAAYWPLLDTGGDIQQNALGGQALTRTSLRSLIAPTTTIDNSTLLEFGAGTASAGEDVSPPLWAPNLATPGGADFVAWQWLRILNMSSPLVLSGTNWLTIAAWVRPGDTGTSQYPFYFTTATDGIINVIADVSGGGFWAVQVSEGAWLVNSISTIPTAIDVPVLVSLRMSLSANTVELRVGSQTQTFAPGGAVPSSLSIRDVEVGDLCAGSISHVQVYLTGTSGDLDATAHAAQYNHGLYGLERQTTGDRIRTLARYAGKTDGELVNVDTGSSVMQRAHLAGLTVAGAMYEARDTEQGDLFMDGSGLLTFDDRRTLYNV